MRIAPRLVVPFAFVATAALSYFGAAYRMAREIEKREAKVDAAYAHIAALGDAAGADMARSLPDDLPTLADACRARLGPMTATSIVTYVPEAPADVTSNLATLLASHPKPYDLRHAGVLPSRVVGGSVDAREPFLALEHASALLEDPRPKGWAAMKALINDDLSPLAWARDVAIEARRGPDVLSARFVAVSLVRAATPPIVVEERSYQGGIAVLEVRVVDITNGAAVCEGKQVVRMPTEISGAPLSAAGESDPSHLASAFDEAITFGALHGLCDLAGESLCAETSRRVR